MSTDSNDLIGRVGDKAPQYQFRDFKREVPAHLAPFFARIPDLHTMTYEQALERVNDAMLSVHLGQAQRDLIRQHFGGM